MLSINTIMHLAGAILFSTAAGIAIASDTVGDMHPNIPRDDFSARAAQPACLDCSDRLRGYEWASSERISSSAACGNAPWEFRQGCEDYLTNGRGI